MHNSCLSKITKPIILVGAGTVGERALRYIGHEKIHCFADSRKAGGEYCGKPVVSFAEAARMQDDYELVVAVNDTLQTEVETCLCGAGARKSIFIGQIWEEHEYESLPEIARFKNIHKGKRCFVLGNGPSLQLDDLNTLAANKEFCFAANRIYKIFDQTEWRPDIYCVADELVLSQNWDTICNLQLDPIFIADYVPCRPLVDRGTKKNIYYAQRHLRTNRSTGRFGYSNDVAKCMFIRGSVVAMMLLLGMHMGFKEFYILGVDNTYKDPQHKNGNTKDHFIDDYFANGEKAYAAEHEAIVRIFKLINQHAEPEGFKIYNATRGGKLEVFERVNFDELF
jgi:hypothetical protein